MKASSLVALVAALLARPTVVLAAEPTHDERPLANRDVRERPVGTMELGVGLLTLPGAAVCVERLQAGCKQGDASPTLEAWPLYKPSRSLAFGAGLTLGLTTTTEPPHRDPAGFERDHARRYFSLDAVARYTVYDGERLDFWLGTTGGLVAVNDTFSPSNTTDKALVGPRSDTIRSEGYSYGIAAGLSWTLSPSWYVGTTLRYVTWRLPDDPAVNAVGDEASLSGRISVILFSLALGYSSPL